MSKLSLTIFYDSISTSEHLIKIASSIYRVCGFENVQANDHESNRTICDFASTLFTFCIPIGSCISKTEKIWQLDEFVETFGCFLEQTGFLTCNKQTFKYPAERW